MSDHDSKARKRAQAAADHADELEQSLQNLLKEFNSAVSRIKELEKEVAKLQEELAPKKLDKPANQFPLKNKD
jgi:predicted nuclease with TOPRIM domain